jgi:hypothetical protein
MVLIIITSGFFLPSSYPPLSIFLATLTSTPLPQSLRVGASLSPRPFTGSLSDPPGRHAHNHTSNTPTALGLSASAESPYRQRSESRRAETHADPGAGAVDPDPAFLWQPTSHPRTDGGNRKDSDFNRHEVMPAAPDLRLAGFPSRAEKEKAPSQDLNLVHTARAQGEVSAAANAHERVTTAPNEKFNDSGVGDREGSFDPSRKQMPAAKSTSSTARGRSGGAVPEFSAEEFMGVAALRNMNSTDSNHPPPPHHHQSSDPTSPFPALLSLPTHPLSLHRHPQKLAVSPPCHDPDPGRLHPPVRSPRYNPADPAPPGAFNPANRQPPPARPSPSDGARADPAAGSASAAALASPSSRVERPPTRRDRGSGGHDTDPGAGGKLRPGSLESPHTYNAPLGGPRAAAAAEKV